MTAPGELDGQRPKECEHGAPQGTRCDACWAKHVDPSHAPGELEGATPTPRTPKHHVLKCWPAYFNEVRAGRKAFECRLNDRDFREGDSIELREYDPETKRYTGERWEGKIGYVLNHPPCGMEKWDGFAVLSLLPARPAPAVSTIEPVATDYLDLDFINGLDQPLFVREYGDKAWWWPVIDFATAKNGAMLRIDVMGKSQPWDFGSVAKIRDANGKEYEPEEFIREDRAALASPPAQPAPKEDDNANRN